MQLVNISIVYSTYAADLLLFASNPIFISSVGLIFIDIGPIPTSLCANPVSIIYS